MTLILLAAALLQPASPPLGQRTATPAQILSQADLGSGDGADDPLVVAAAAFPLGSARNPVRVGGPEGAQAYLVRLRCADGSAPRLLGTGVQGAGAFGSVVTAYQLDCGAAAPGRPSVIFDLYHAEHRESRAVAGFSIEP